MDNEYEENFIDVMRNLNHEFFQLNLDELSKKKSKHNQARLSAQQDIFSVCRESSGRAVRFRIWQQSKARVLKEVT